MEEVGEITHYFPKIGVAVVTVMKHIRVGDTIRIRGHATDFEQEVESMQVDQKNITEAKKGDDIGLKVDDLVKKGDKVYIV